ncbi:hypothetical protein KN1_23800 [Stygiolobus caldivivus]|uniref:Uncharacterized protein n=1 Tax=Stygiolobus caldivivus TaxID=2824673 RepID=A0A8D5ZGM6_9CREN|nr:hypothetical protein KN1_23800 [Stygiolobus caldivivus]
MGRTISVCRKGSEEKAEILEGFFPYAAFTVLSKRTSWFRNV